MGEDAAANPKRYGVVVQAPFFRHRARAVRVSRTPIARDGPAASRPLHVARMLALAHEIVRLIDEGTFADLADAARVLGFTRARITQLVDLTMLAPPIQEHLLFVAVERGRDLETEHGLRRLVAERSWPRQLAGRMLGNPGESIRLFTPVERPSSLSSTSLHADVDDDPPARGASAPCPRRGARV